MLKVTRTRVHRNGKEYSVFEIRIPVRWMRELGEPRAFIAHLNDDGTITLRPTR